MMNTYFSLSYDCVFSCYMLLHWAMLFLEEDYDAWIPDVGKQLMLVIHLHVLQFLCFR